MRPTFTHHAGFIASFRQFVEWNRSNAATNLPATPSSISADARVKKAASPSALSADALSHTSAVVQQRWSCKHFDSSRPLDPKVLEEVLTTTLRAPTGFNLQGWVAVAVQSQEGREKLCRAALGQRQVADAPLCMVFAGKLEPEDNAPQTLELGLNSKYLNPSYGPTYLRNIFYFLHGGPCQSVAYAKTALSTAYSYSTGTPLLTVPLSRQAYAWKQSMIAATTFLHLCTAAGWDTCVLEGIDEGAVMKAVDIPAGYTVPVVIVVGHAIPDAPRRDQRSPRFPLGKMIRSETFTREFPSRKD